MPTDWMNSKWSSISFQEENHILLEQLGGKPKRFTDAQRIWLASLTKATKPSAPCIGEMR